MEYHARMTTILLAAGLSSRMGRNKLLLPYNGKSVIEETLNAVLAASGRIIVVTGHEKERIEEKLCHYPVDFVHNSDYMKGQRSSTMRGIEAVEDDDFAILPADLPLLSEESVRMLYASLETSSIVRPVHASVPGHPVCYRKENREKLLHHTGTMKEYLKKEGVTEIPSPIGCVYDVDTPSRYDALLVSNGDLSVLERYID